MSLNGSLVITDHICIIADGIITSYNGNGKRIYELAGLADIGRYRPRTVAGLREYCAVDRIIRQHLRYIVRCISTVMRETGITLEAVKPYRIADCFRYKTGHREYLHQPLTLSRSSIQSVYFASEGILQSPLGDSETVPTLGPSGTQDLLNCCVKNLLMNVSSHL